jgi:integrase
LPIDGEYTPAIKSEYWAEIEPFVTAAVAESVALTPYSHRELFQASSRLVLWAWQSAGLPLEREVIFDRSVIGRFIAVGLSEYTEAGRGNRRSQLLRMSEALLDARTAPRRLAPMAASDPTAPYLAHELAALRSWADRQSTEERRRNARVLLALGLGGGLSAGEIGETRVGQIHVDSEGVLLRVGGDRARTVPVLRDWEDALSARRAELSADRYAFRPNHTANYPNLISNFVAYSGVQEVKPVSQRMRSTWIVHHLQVGTPVVPLLRAAGVESLEAFTRYVRFLPAGDADGERRRLRG